MTKHWLGVLLFLVFAVIAFGPPTVVAATQSSAQALDPLSAEEKATAEKLVRADPTGAGVSRRPVPRWPRSSSWR